MSGQSPLTAESETESETSATPDGDTGTGTGSEGAKPDSQTGTETTGNQTETPKPAEKPAESAKADDAPYELALPKDAKLDADAAKAIAEWAQKQGISKDAAQALLDRENEMVAAAAQARQERDDATLKAWQQELEQDPEFGGEKLKAAAEAGKRVIERFGGSDKGKEVKDFLDATGLSWNPIMVRLMARIGAAMADDKFVTSTHATTAKPKSLGDALYPDKP